MTHTTTNGTASSLPLPDHLHHALLDSFTSMNEPIPSLCAAYQLTVQQLLAWLESERTQRDLAAMQRITEARERIVASLSRVSVLSALEHIATDPDGNRETARKAAALILQQTAPSPPPASTPTPGDDRVPQVAEQPMTDSAAPARAPSRLAPPSLNEHSGPAGRLREAAGSTAEAPACGLGTAGAPSSRSARAPASVAAPPAAA